MSTVVGEDGAWRWRHAQDAAPGQRACTTADFVEPREPSKESFVFIEQDGFEDKLARFVVDSECNELQLRALCKTSEADLIQMRSKTGPKVAASDVLDP